MKKKLVIDKCKECAYFNRIGKRNEAPKPACFGRDKIFYLTNDTSSSIPDDCPLETVEANSK